MPGLRLVLTVGLPGPWGEAVKAVLACKGLAFIPVAQVAGEENPELVDWTGQSSAPVLVYNHEPPRISWLDQLLLAERLAPDVPLLPVDMESRAMVVGLCQEIAGENGLGWHRRLQLLGLSMQSGSAPEGIRRMAAKYGWSEQAHVQSGARLTECLRFFARLLHNQHHRGSRYLVGETFTAADIYLANFIGMLNPLPVAENPMPDYMRKTYQYLPDELAEALDPALLDYRDETYRKHLTTPLEF